MITQVDHIGIAVSNIDEAMLRYARLFNVTTFHRERVEDQGVDIASFELGEVRIELTAPLSDDSPIAKFIAKRGEGIHHVAFRSDDIEGDLTNARHHGVDLINETPQPGAHDMLIAFLHPKSTGGVLMEFCTEKKDG
jgi:methylmalonyl-CoA/ethylmalonyl-CoA epimerase